MLLTFFFPNPNGVLHPSEGLDAQRPTLVKSSAEKPINPEGVVPELEMRMVFWDWLHLFDSTLGFAVSMIRGSFMP
jgi:hypothetical protein